MVTFLILTPTWAWGDGLLRIDPDILFIVEVHDPVHGHKINKLADMLIWMTRYYEVNQIAML